MKEVDKAFGDLLKISKTNDKIKFSIQQIKTYLLLRDKISLKSMTENLKFTPLTYNLIKFIENSKNPIKASKEIIKLIKINNEKLVSKSLSIIKRNSNIFVFSPSNTIIKILKLASKSKHFVVYNIHSYNMPKKMRIEQQLAKTKIKLISLNEYNLDYSLKKCDVFLFDSDLFSNAGAITTNIGTRHICNILKLYKKHIYSCGISFMYSKSKILRIKHSEKISKQNITKVISEFGILPYKEFIKKSNKLSNI